MSSESIFYFVWFLYIETHIMNPYILLDSYFSMRLPFFIYSICVLFHLAHILSVLSSFSCIQVCICSICFQCANYLNLKYESSFFFHFNMLSVFAFRSSQPSEQVPQTQDYTSAFLGLSGRKWSCCGQTFVAEHNFKCVPIGTLHTIGCFPSQITPFVHTFNY